jgi:hypothetical protein
MQAAVVPMVEDRAVSSFILAADCNILSIFLIAHQFDLLL